MKSVLATFAALALAGCMSTSAPAVSEQNSAGIRLVTQSGVAPPFALAQTQTSANRYCAAMGKRAYYADTRQLRSGAAEHYYQCIR